LEDVPSRPAPEPVAVVVDPLAAPHLPEAGIDLRDAVERFEGALIEQALERAGGNRSKAALILRMNRTTLVEKLRKRGLGEEHSES
jgi:DNA-binding NtrC family response regulator